MHYFVFGNYGNNTIALMRWLYLREQKNVFVLNTDTGWAAECWAKRVERGQLLAKQYDFQPVTVRPPKTFADQIIDRGQFPSVKFQWCAAFLKGLAFTHWADEQDPNCHATVIIGSRRADSRARFNLPEFEEKNEHFGGRRVWYPLFNTNNDERDALIQQTGLTVLTHRSLECNPCVHNSVQDLSHMSEQDQDRVRRVEQIVNIPIIPILDKENNLENFDMGCGSSYACGE